jgi:replicative DNA helicase
MMDESLYNLAFERSVLSALLFSCTPEGFEEVFYQLDESLFYLGAHQDIYGAVRTLHRSGQPVDEEFIKRGLQAEKRFDEGAMLEVMSANPVSNVEAYTHQLRDMARKRRILTMTTEIKKMILEEFATADDVQAMIDRELTDLEDRSGIGMPITMAQAIEMYDGMEEPPKISTGIMKLDEMLCGGIEPAQLVHVGGEKNVGKTTLLKQILYNTSAGFDSLFFSFEMPAWKMAKYTKRMSGPADLHRYRIIDTQMMKSRDVMDVARMIRMMHRKHGIRFVLIDSKMKLTHRTFKGNSDSDRKGDIDAVLNAVVQETGITLMMITQLKKDDIEKGTMSNYGSGLSDYAADMQIMLYHSKDTKGAIEARVTKERQEVRHEPVKLWLNRDELKFDDSRHVEVVYGEGQGSHEEEGGMIKVEMPVIN